MNAAILQHIDFEGPGILLPMLEQRGFSVERYLLYNNPAMPDPEMTDLLVIMGGFMGVRDEATYAWMAPEKELIRAMASAGKKVIGICLGAQLIASALGAEVRKNSDKEIGWFPVRVDKSASPYSSLPEEFMALHWHGDTFEIPEGAIAFAESDGCKNQAFLYNKNVLALQFHIEATDESVEALVTHAADEITGPSPWLQDADIIRKNTVLHASAAQQILADIFQEFLPSAKPTA